MRIRNGFVSNSSSCSFIFLLPKHTEFLSNTKIFKEHFGLKSMYDHEVEELSHEDRAKKMITKNCFMFNNR